jgi:hypothetical protein
VPLKLTHAIVPAIGITIVSSFSIGCGRPPPTVKARIEDVRRLVQLHAEHQFTNTEISQLLALLAIAKEKSIELSNPIAKDRAAPCYRIVLNETNELSSVIIEETANADDSKLVVRGYADGHVSVERKKINSTRQP